jgi:hypothetical protein
MVHNAQGHGKPVDSKQLAENEEAQTAALVFHSAVKLLLKTLPDDGAPLKEFDDFMREMEICRNTLVSCLETTQAKMK